MGRCAVEYGERAQSERGEKGGGGAAATTTTGTAIGARGDGAASIGYRTCCVDDGENFVFAVDMQNNLRTYDWASGSLLQITSLPMRYSPTSMAYLDHYTDRSRSPLGRHGNDDYDVNGSGDDPHVDTTTTTTNWCEPTICFSGPTDCYFHSLYTFLSGTK